MCDEMGGHWVPSCPFYLPPCGQGAQSPSLFICQRKPVHLALDTGTQARLCHRLPDPLSCQHTHHTFHPAICHCAPVLRVHVCPHPAFLHFLPTGKGHQHHRWGTDAISLLPWSHSRICRMEVASRTCRTVW